MITEVGLLPDRFCTKTNLEETMRQSPDKKSVIAFFITLGVILFGPVLLMQVGNPNWPDQIQSAESTEASTVLVVKHETQ